MQLFELPASFRNVENPASDLVVLDMPRRRRLRAASEDSSSSEENGEGRMCCVCFSADEESFIQVDNCRNPEHTVCLDCLAGHVRQHLTEQNNSSDIICPGCRDDSRCCGRVTRDGVIRAARHDENDGEGLPLVELYDRIKAVEDKVAIRCPHCNQLIATDFDNSAGIDLRLWDMLFGSSGGNRSDHVSMECLLCE